MRSSRSRGGPRSQIAIPIDDHDRRPRARMRRAHAMRAGVPVRARGREPNRTSSRPCGARLCSIRSASEPCCPASYPTTHCCQNVSAASRYRPRRAISAKFGGFGSGGVGSNVRPALPGNPGLHPRVRVGSAHQPQLGHRIVDSALKPGGEPRRDADGAQHHRHRGGEVLAVALAAIEQEIRERVGDLVARQFERVAVVASADAVRWRARVRDRWRTAVVQRRASS